MKKILILIWSVLTIALLSAGVVSARSLDCRGFSGDASGFPHVVISAKGTIEKVNAPSALPIRFTVKANNKTTAHIEFRTNIGGNGYINGYKYTIKINKKSREMDVLRTDYYFSGYTKTHRYNGYCNYLVEEPVAKIVKTAKPTTIEKEFKKYPLEHRKRVQTVLKTKGYYKLSIDGMWGKGTKTAVEKYAANIDLNNKEAVRKFYTQLLEFQPKEKTCDDDPTLCSIANLCSNATALKNGKRVWVTQASKKSHVKEAKKNGLRCGIEIKPEKPTAVETYKVASGTGFYISTLGHLVTNHHVIEGCKKVKAHRKGVAQEATIIAVDRLNDLALLQVKIPSSYVFPISKENPYPLQEIIVAGFPFGNAISSSIKFTQGIVSSMSGIGDNYSQIQIDAAIQPGNSGGPIVDELGNVIAVAVSKLDLKKVLKDFGVVPENTNFGIKSSAVINLLDGNNVSPVRINTKPISKGDLSRNVTEGTTHLSCWMTMAQIEQLKTKKVLFNEFE